jgi:cell division protein ZapE
MLRPSERNLTTSFINLIDIFYDKQIRVIISAAVPIVQLYPQGELQFEFERTKSRLIEMQSVEYLNLNR